MVKQLLQKQLWVYYQVLSLLLEEKVQRLISAGKIFWISMRKRCSKLGGKEISMIFQDPMTSLNPTHEKLEIKLQKVFLHNDMSYSEARNVGS